jgi:hypothetical protein
MMRISKGCILKLPLVFEEGDTCVKSLLAFNDSFFFKGDNHGGLRTKEQGRDEEESSQPQEHDERSTKEVSLAKSVFKLLKDCPLLERQFQQYVRCLTCGQPPSPCNFCRNAMCYYAAMNQASSDASSWSSLMGEAPFQRPHVDTTVSSPLFALVVKDKQKRRPENGPPQEPPYDDYHGHEEKVITVPRRTEEEPQSSASVAEESEGRCDDQHDYEEKCFEKNAREILPLFAAFASSTLQAAHVRLAAKYSMAKRARSLHDGFSSSTSSSSCSPSSYLSSSNNARTEGRVHPHHHPPDAPPPNLSPTTNNNDSPNEKVFQNFDYFLEALVAASEEWNSCVKSFSAPAGAGRRTRISTTTTTH